MAQTPLEAFVAAGFETPAPEKELRTCIGVDEIEPGVVILQLDPVDLRQHNGVLYTQDPPVTRIGPFVCVAVDGDMTLWAGLTFKRRVERLELNRDWKIGGTRRWRDRTQYLTDGASLWLGPKEAFSAASWRETVYEQGRPLLSPAGLAAVRQKIRAALDPDAESAAPASADRVRHEAALIRDELLMLVSPSQ